VVFMLLMNIVLYDPMRKIVEKRSKLLEQNDNETTENKNKTKILETEKNQLLEQARNESRNIISDITTQAKKVRTEKINSITAEIKSSFENSVSELDTEAKNIKHEIKNDVVDLAQNILEKISGKNVALTTVSDEDYKKVMDNES